MPRNQKPRVEGQLRKQISVNDTTLHASFVENKNYKGLTDFVGKINLNYKPSFDFAFKNIFKLIDTKVFDKVVEEIKKRGEFKEFFEEALESLVAEDEEEMMDYFKKWYLSEIVKTKGTYFIDDDKNKIYFYNYFLGKPILSDNPKFFKLVDQKVARIIDDEDDGKTYLVAQDDKSRKILYNIYNDEDN